MARQSDEVHALVLPDPATSKRWTCPGGEEDDETMTLFVGTRGPNGSKAYNIILKLVIDDDGGLTVPETTVEPIR